MKIYITTKGEYSDYRIVSVHSRRESAESAVVFHGLNEGVEEFELDDEIRDVPEGMTAWCVPMEITGKTIAVGRSSGDDVKERSSEGTRPAWCKSFPTVREFHVWARDQEHAIKIVNERRIALIASGDWKE